MIYIIIAAVMYTAAVLLATSASRAINSNLVAAIINVLSAIIPVAVVAPLLIRRTFVDHKTAVLLAVLSGVAISLFSMALTKSYTLNKVAVVIPIVFGGMIFLTAIGGYIFFKEKISLFQGLGLALLGAGLIFITYARITGK